METLKVDVAVIGAGTAGLSARREAAKAGAKVVMIESGPYGTTCARVGCMPSKLLVAAAETAHGIGMAREFGVDAAPARIDGPAVLQRVRRHRDRFVGFVVEATEKLPEAERLRGRVRFVAPNALVVDNHTRVEAKAVVIATGSTPFVPASLAPAGDRVLTTDSIFELADLPESIAVVGAGVIGLEIGQSLHRLGVRTAIFSHSDRVGPSTDPEVGRAVRETLAKELDLHLNAFVEAEPADGGVVVRWRAADGTRAERRFAALLAATGRIPNVDGLGLEHAGVRLDPRRIPLFDERTMQCGDTSVFLAGDAGGHRSILHEASDEGTIAGRNAARFPDVRAHTRRTRLEVVFSDPQIATVGRSFASLQQDQIEIGSIDYSDQGRAVVMAKNAGLARIYASENGTLLGAEMFGPRVENMAHLLAWAVQMQLDVERALAMPFYHPVLEEGLRTALRDLCARLKLRAPERPEDMECGPGV